MKIDVIIDIGVTLRDLKPGERGRVVGYVGEPHVRLMEMGLLPGTEVEVIRYAPFGDPIDVKVRRFHLSLRKEDAAHIEVERR